MKYSLELLTEYFYINPLSKTGLSNLKDRFSGHNYKNLCAVTGADTGSMDAAGYYCVCLFRKSYKVHRIIYSIMNKCTLTEEEFIDHINGNPSDNRVENLRVVSKTGNSRNHKIRKSNKSGITGVTLIRNEGWVAHWKEGSFRKSKYFGISKYGMDTAFKLACEYREEKIKELNLLGYNYSYRHGL